MIRERRIDCDNVRGHIPAKFYLSVIDRRGIIEASVVGHAKEILIVNTDRGYKKNQTDPKEEDKKTI